MTSEPVFFIGMPRSGTTVVFEAFARAKDFGWLSNYSEMWPRLPAANLLCPLLDNPLINARGHKKQYGAVVPGNRYLPQPVEAYEFWDYYSQRNFSRCFLNGERASEADARRLQKAVSSVLRFQFKKRLVTKLTGPGRIGYLASAFPNATFLHVVRDGRAVAGSLLQVKFWKEKGGYDKPFWDGGLREEDLVLWETLDRDPAVLAAIQWRRVIEVARLEAQDVPGICYKEIRYEDYILDPPALLGQLFDMAGCDREANVDKEGSSRGGAAIENMNEKYLKSFGDSRLKRITAIMQPLLEDFGYPLT